MSDNGSYRNPRYRFLRTVRQLITHPRLGISDGLPFTCLRTSDNRLQDTSILRSAQMFVRYEDLPSSPDNKGNQIQILYYVHVR